MAIGICCGQRLRLMTLCFCWGSFAITASPWWWWIPVVCSHLGGVLGVALHLVFIEWEWTSMAKDINTADIEKEEQEI